MHTPIAGFAPTYPAQLRSPISGELHYVSWLLRFCVSFESLPESLASWCGVKVSTVFKYGTWELSQGTMRRPQGLNLKRSSCEAWLFGERTAVDRMMEPVPLVIQVALV